MGSPSPSTAADAYGWDEDWRDRLVSTQEVVVHALQRKLVADAAPSHGRLMKSGETKDLSVALAAAIDKLNVLRSLSKASPSVSLQPDGFVQFEGAVSSEIMEQFRAAWASMPKGVRAHIADPLPAPPADSEMRG